MLKSTHQSPSFDSSSILLYRNENSLDIVLQFSICDFNSATSQGSLIRAIAIPWHRIVKELHRDPGLLYQFAEHPRRFEEFVAASYDMAGCPEVILTPQSGDLGRDVIATWPGIGSVRIYDQAKAISRHRKVTANDVRAMLGVIERDKNVSKGIVTTTGEFAPGVLDEFRT